MYEQYIGDRSSSHHHGDWRLATGDWRLATGDWRLAAIGDGPWLSREYFVTAKKNI